MLSSPSIRPDGPHEGPILRFAPSPNGYLHLGHAYSVLMNERVAQRLGGRLLLRFEDIDSARCRPEYEAAAIADLEWLGVRFTPPILRQSERYPAYAEALDRLRQLGLIYPCFCSRGDIARAVADRADWPRDPDGAPLYPGTCRSRKADRDVGMRPAALRLDMVAALSCTSKVLTWTEYLEGTSATIVQAHPARWGDVLLARKDVRTSYSIAVVVDDAAQGITDVVRGEDLFAATGLHRLLQSLLGLPAPQYHHHRLLRGDNGFKLAKREGAPALKTLREAGLASEGIRLQLGYGVSDHVGCLASVDMT